MKRFFPILVVAVLSIMLFSACGPTTPAPTPPTQVAQIEDMPTIARPLPVTFTPLSATATASSGCPVPPGWSPYIIKTGDTLYALSIQVNLTPEEVMRANCLTSTLIGVGISIFLPLESCTVAPPSDWHLYSVHSGDTLFSLAAARRTTVAEVKRVNCRVSDSLDIGTQLYLPPAPPITPAPVVPTQVVRPQTPVSPIGTDNEVNLPSELFYAPPAAGQDCWDTPNVMLPAIASEGLTHQGDKLVLCLYGFPTDEDLTVTFYTDYTTLGSDIILANAEGDIVSAQSGKSVGFDYPGTGNIALFPWWPLDLPETVYVQVSSTSKVARQIIRNTELGPRVGFLITGGYLPFADRSLDNDECIVLNAPATLQFLGSNFVPRQRIPVGLYTARDSSTMTLTLSASHLAVTDNMGRFQIPMTVGTSDLLGRHYIVAVTDPNKINIKYSPQADCYKLE